MRGSLLDVIDRLDAVDDSDRFSPPVIYAEGGPNAPPTARALVCPGDEAGTFACPGDPNLSEVLMVGLAKEAIRVWSSWRCQPRPDPMDKFAAVIYYSRHDAFLPLHPTNAEPGAVAGAGAV